MALFPCNVGGGGKISYDTTGMTSETLSLAVRQKYTIPKDGIVKFTITMSWGMMKVNDSAASVISIPSSTYTSYALVIVREGDEIYTDSASSSFAFDLTYYHN